MVIPLEVLSLLRIVFDILDFLLFQMNLQIALSNSMKNSLIHLDLSFGRGDKNGLICMLLHVYYQLNQHQLLKNTVFYPLDGFSFFVKDQVTIGAWVHFWGLQFYSIDLPVYCCTSTMQFLITITL